MIKGYKSQLKGALTSPKRGNKIKMVTDYNAFRKVKIHGQS